jgi:2-oxoglutarate ferredoxin oxidoreductase subunit alpha
MTIEVNFMVGGEAGQGVQSVGFLLAKALARAGYQVFADQDYESRVRGGHNFFRVRTKDSELGAIADKIDVLVALNKDSIDLHRDELTRGGAIIYDSEKIQDFDAGDGAIGLPLEKLARDEASDRVMANTVALGAALGLTGYDLKLANKAIREHFSGQIGEANVRAALAGYDYIQNNYKEKSKHELQPIKGAERMLLTGNEAIFLGAISAGCRFMAAYPMTPASSIMEYFAAKSEDYGLVMVHAEDEISAVNMAIGAGFAGVRAMTATSGSGFCLMVEGLGLAGITETPVVIIDAQRPGPAVGLPTRTEQGDLQFALHAHHGDFPRAVLAPASVEDCFWITAKAFNLAEKYQLPVIILTDQHLASSYATVGRFDLSKVTIERGPLFSAQKGDEEYKRHRITESGVSPRAFPGQKGALVVTDSDEHDEAGHLIEDATIRTAIVDKRLRKLAGLSQEIKTPQLHGAKEADLTLIGWGSTYGALKEAADLLQEDKLKVNILHLNELYPFPAKAVADVIASTGKTFVVENNASGQLAQLITAETGKKVSGHILKYDGRPFTPKYIAEALKKEVG